MFIEGKPNQSMALTQCALRGVGVSSRNFAKLVHEYNGYIMPISERVKLIAEEKDELFFEWIKDRI